MIFLRFIIQILIQVGPILATINLLNGSDSFIHSSRTWLNMNHLLLEITNGQMTHFWWTLKWEKGRSCHRAKRTSQLSQVPPFSQLLQPRVRLIIFYFSGKVWKAHANTIHGWTVYNRVYKMYRSHVNLLIDSFTKTHRIIQSSLIILGCQFFYCHCSRNRFRFLLPLQ